MEEESKNGAPHAPLPLHGRRHPRPHDAAEVGAGPGVEAGRQLRVGRGSEDGDDDGEANEGRPAGEDGRHCTLTI